MRGVTAVAALFLSALAGACGPPPRTRAAGAVSPLAVRGVEWNPARADVGRVRAVADDGDVVAVFSDRGATVFASKALVAADRAVAGWVSAAAIAGADGTARWLVGVSDKGRIYYLRGSSAFEDVTDRFGLSGARVRDATPLGTGCVGFLLDGAIAIADGTHVTRYGAAGPTFDELAGGAGIGAAIRKNEVDAFDVARRGLARFSLRGAAHAVIGRDGRLYVATSRAVYAADAGGRLALVYDAGADTIHGLVASGANVWFADGDELGVVTGDRVAETNGAKIGRDAKLAPSSTGDVWVIANGGLGRFGRVSTVAPDASAWGAAIAPIFAKSCSACHLPGGVSGTDLSTEKAWGLERTEIRARVVERRSMPPQGHPLSDVDRDAIRAWVEGNEASSGAR